MSTNLFTFFIGIWFNVLWFNSSAFSTTSVLVCHESVSAEECSQFITSKKNLISFIDTVGLNYGSVSREMIQTVSELESAPESLPRIQTEAQLIKELTSGPLTPVRKNLLIKVLKPFSKEKANRDTQLMVFLESPLKTVGSITPPLKFLREDDQLFINGFEIHSNELNQIKLLPNIRYHIAYLSNVTHPVYQWALAEEIQPFQIVNLVRGSCQFPQLNNMVSGENPLALFAKNCVGRASHHSEEIQLGGPASIPEDSRKETQWNKNRAWAIGGSLLLFGTLIYEVQRNYDISVTLPF